MRFDTLVFSGGGSRCFWQLGFWQALAPALTAPPARLLGVSGGAVVACAAEAGVAERFLEHSCETFDANHANFHTRELLRGRNPFPHPRLVTEGFAEVFDAPALARLHAGVPVHVLASVLPPRIPPLASSLAVQAAFVLEKEVGRVLHGTWGTRLGFTPFWRAAAECPTPEALRELVLASSAIPPAFGVRRLDGLRLMDGGFVGNALIEFDGSDPGRMLVLVTRHDWPIPEDDGRRLYVRPSRPNPVGKLDATSGARARAAYELGLRDGEAFLGGTLNCA